MHGSMMHTRSRHTLIKRLSRFLRHRRLPWAPWRSSRQHLTDVADETELSQQLVPLLVVASGRSGTTLLMHLLGSSAQIAFERRYPYECQCLSYFLRWCQLVSQFHPPDDKWNPRVLGHDHDGPVGSFLWRDLELVSDRDLEYFSSRCFQEVWRAFSQTIRSRARSKAPPAYFAEKMNIGLIPAVRQRLPLRVIYPIRDPRDVYLSSLAFNRKRETHRFSFKPGDTPEAFRKRVIPKYRDRLRAALQARDEPDSRVVRYEELVGSLQQEVQRLSDWLGVELNASSERRARRQFKHHMTSDSPEASIERWKREMSPAVNREFVRGLRDELNACGYET